VKPLIYSFLGLRKDDTTPRPDLMAMYDLWLKHLRGPGNYHGDILLISPYGEELARPGVQVRAPFHQGTTPQEAFLARVRNHTIIPFTAYDVMLQTDLDVLAIRDVSPLFAIDTPFHAATSNLRLYDPRHAGNWRHFAATAWRGWLPQQHSRLGVSACVFACNRQHWLNCMGHWTRLIERHQHGHLAYDDQTLLNVALANRTFPITPYPPSELLTLAKLK
jgi:hypothetical protein